VIDKLSKAMCNGRGSKGVGLQEDLILAYRLLLPASGSKITISK